MRALTYLGPWQMAVTESPIPDIADGWAQIDVIATGICGSDAHGYTGSTGRRVAGQVMGHEMVGLLHTPLPHIPAGSIVTFNPAIGCGTCAACRAGQTQVCPTLRVVGVEPTLAGSFADSVVVPAANVVQLSEIMPIAHGALVEPLTVGFHAVMRGNPIAEDRVVVVGGGPIGQAVALGARRVGISSVVISEPVPSKRATLEQLGFPAVAPEDLADTAPGYLGGLATLVIDAVGIEASIQAAIEVSAPSARIVLVGMGSREVLLRPYGLSAFERSLIGSYCYSNEHFSSTARWVAAGRPELNLLIDRLVPLEEGQEAFREVAEGSLGGNKTLLLSRPIATTSVMSSQAVIR